MAKGEPVLELFLPFVNYVGLENVLPSILPTGLPPTRSSEIYLGGEKHNLQMRIYIIQLIYVAFEDSFRLT